MKRAILSLALVMGVAACSTEQLVKMNMGPMDNQPQAFQDGYKAGCATGLRAAGNTRVPFTKDVARYDSDRLYTSGWDDGYRVCRSNALSS